MTAIDPLATVTVGADDDGFYAIVLAQPNETDPGGFWVRQVPVDVVPR